MNVVAWVLSGLLALVFLGVGVAKLLTPRDKLAANPRMGWTNDFTGPQITSIGALEVLGAVGLILPWLLDIVRVLTPLAAVGLALVMIGAVVTHGRRSELKDSLPANGLLLAIAVAVAVIRFSQL